MTKAPSRKRGTPPVRKATPVRRRSAGALVHRATNDPTVGVLLERIVAILEDARARVVRSVDSETVLAYWHIGHEIVDHMQKGAARADYGDRLLEQLSADLGKRIGRGYSVTNLRYFRLFYQVYADREPKIRHTARDESQAPRAKHHKARDVLASLELSVKPAPALVGFSDRLSWSHYRTLTKVEHAGARAFYEIEAADVGWSVPHLERQIHSQLFARLLKSRNKAGVMDLASRGQVLERPIDTIKQPYVLDFLDLPESPKLRESDLEGAILEKLQHFLLELGKGFAFVARQRRLSFDDESFYVDLVFYNVILKCYMLIDLKLGKLTHQDVGQMDSYVRMFDDQGRTEGDGPTIGLILCAEKNDAVARYSVLHENEQLFAAKYVTYLPSVEELERELAHEKRVLEASGKKPTRRSKR